MGFKGVGLVFRGDFSVAGVATQCLKTVGLKTSIIHVSDVLFAKKSSQSLKTFALKTTIFNVPDVSFARKFGWVLRELS